MGPKIPDLRVFGVEFENTIVIFETNTPNLSNCKISRTRMSKFGTKSLICIFLCWNLKGLLSYLKSASLNLSCCKVSAKVKILTFGAKNVLFGYFWARISKKNYCHNWNKHPRICLIAKFWEKTKTSKYGTKNALSGYFGLEFENNIIMLETNTLNLSTCKILWKKQKYLNLGPKILLCVPYFCTGIWKYYCHIWNLRPLICLVAKFGAKILKFGTKSTWFEYFWAGTWKTACHIWN